jgi:hypothetical protein
MGTSDQFAAAGLTLAAALFLPLTATLIAPSNC